MSTLVNLGHVRKFRKSLISQLFGGASSVYAADIDGDGDIDVIGAGKAANQIAWWENVDAAGTDWNKNWISTDFDGACSVYGVDIDNDGDVDVLGAGSIIGQIIVWENLNGLGILWSQHTVEGSYAGALSVYAGDMDGDLDYDVLGASSEANDISWWENVDGSGSEWIRHIIDEDCSFVKFASTSDIDGDGDVDVLAARWSEGNVSWWENSNGSGTSWIEHYIDSDFDKASEVYGFDIDADGDIDVLGAARGADEITWWENVNGSGSDWLKHTVCDSLDYAYTVYAGDFDGDGDLDVVGGGYAADEVRWWENLSGTGIYWIEHVLDSEIDGPESVHAADLNGNGIKEVLCAAKNSQEISWWAIFTYPNTGYLQSSILDLQEHPEWLAVDWSGMEPPGTDIVFQFRTSGNPDNMGVWTNYITSPCDICDIVDDGDYLFQYRVRFFTDHNYYTPVLEDFLVSWDPDGLEEGDIQGYQPIEAYPNPARGFPSLLFALPETSLVSIVVCDLSGRVVETLSCEFEEGQHFINLAPLSPGVYFAELQTDNFNDVCRFIVID